jgi:RHS repeat-associated protein
MPRVSRNGATDGALLTTTYTFDDLGNIRAVQDPLGDTSSYSYVDRWSDTTHCQPVGGNGQGYVTLFTNALSQNVQLTYVPCTGLTQAHQDQNDINAGRAGTTYLYDLFGRQTQKKTPDGGETDTTYNDVPPVSVTTTTKINSAQNLVKTQVSDGLARPTQTQLTSDPQGTIYTDTTYDALGRIYTVSNPYRSGSDPTTSLGSTVHIYDALNRPISVTEQDNSVTSTSYSGNCTTVTDEVGKARKSCSDGLGRLTQVFEDPAGLNYETDYTYNPLNNLTAVTQAGSRQRSFAYDSLSRLTRATNPESGTITYSYDANGNVLTKTDARNITTNYYYDALNRLTQKYYSDGTITADYFYDQTSPWGTTLQNPIGRLTTYGTYNGAWVTAGEFSYDPMGRPVLNVQNTPSGLHPVSYAYDLAGNITSITYPSGRVVNYTYDSANRPSKAMDGSNGITYATDFQSAPSGCLSGAVCYTPQGTFYALSIGQTSSFSGLNLTHTYNSRLEPNEFKASSTAGNAIDISYGFVDPVTAHNSGNVYAVTNNLDGTRSQTFTYDSLNRVTSALTTSTYAMSPVHCWGENYSVDAWGNLQSISQTTNSNYNGCVAESGFSATVDGNNHFTSFAYDASGNTENDGTFAYTWDAESRLTSSGGVTYTYDAQGQRVAKSNGKNYIYDLSGNILAETDASGNTLNEYIFFGGKRIAVISAAGGEALPVQNASFEDAGAWTYSCGSNCSFNVGPIPGWSYTEGAGWYGSLEPGSVYYNPPLPDGNIVAWSNGGTLSQTLTGVDLQPNTTYTLSAYVGHRLDGLVTTYSMSLLAGSTTLNTVSGSNSTVPLGQFGQVTLTYTTGSTVTPGDLSIQLTSGGSQIDFDKVSLTTSGGVYYYVEDMLGTSRVMTSNTGVVCYDGDFYPFGGERPYLDTCPQNYKFEGKERDVETGNDDFGARSYSNRFGRWLSADWSDAPEPVPYASFGRPQSLNLYGMVADDPESFADLDGHKLVCTNRTWTDDKGIHMEVTCHEEPDPKPSILEVWRAYWYNYRNTNDPDLKRALMWQMLGVKAIPIPAAPGGDSVGPPAGAVPIPTNLLSLINLLDTVGAAADWVWRGTGPPGSSQGNWTNPNTGEWIHRDFPGGGHGPHFDYGDPQGKRWRVFPDKGIMEPK